jgi:hypothetical protein
MSGLTRPLFALLLVLALTLPACGGGGGGSTDGGSTGGGSSGGGGVGAGGPGSGLPTLTVSNNAVSATAAPTDGAPGLAVSLSIANPPAAGFYYQTAFGGTAVVSANMAWEPIQANAPDSGGLDLTLYGPGFMGSGTYHDTVTVYVCTDSACQHQIQGSPVAISVTYTVTGNAVSDSTYALLPTALALESPSNAVAQSTTVNVTAYDVPPYGAYVFMTSESGGPVANMTFKQTGASAEPYAYGTGVLTVNMKLPASLGPGVYSDLIKLSICYDAACAKPAVGSPFEIPVTYTVTASAGREFQEQVIEQNLTALAVDASGQFLYAVTAPANVDSANVTPPQLLKVDPTTGAVTTLRSLPAAVQQLAVSQDGAYLYLLTEPWSGTQQNPPVGVLRVRTSDMSIDQTVGLTSNTVQPTQIAVSPVDSNAWSAAVSTQTDVFSVDIFDGQVARANAWSITSNVVYGNEAIWSSDASTMYILDANLSAVAVSATGLGTGTQLQAGSAGQAGFSYGGVQLAGGLLYGATGAVLDPKTDAIVGQYNLPAGLAYALLTIDTVNNRTFAVYNTLVVDTEQGTIQSFNRSTFSPLWIARLPIGSQLLRWGSNGLAWIGPGSSVGQQALYIINGTFVAP